MINAARENHIKGKDLKPISNTINVAEMNGVLEALLYEVQDLFHWWFVQMPITQFFTARRISLVVEDLLSISLLIKTFFVPWHRDYQPIGYLIGIVMRILYLPIAIVTWLILSILAFAIIPIWLLTPIFTLIFIFLSPIL